MVRSLPQRSKPNEVQVAFAEALVLTTGRSVPNVGEHIAISWLQARALDGTETFVAVASSGLIVAPNGLAVSWVLVVCKVRSALPIVGQVAPDDKFVVEEGFGALLEDWHKAEERDEGKFAGGQNSRERE